MVDVLGNKVEVGDKVLFIPNHYKELLDSVRVKIKFSKSSSYIKASNQFVKI